jgi:hypothetical protein
MDIDVVRMPDMSVHRGKYCTAECILRGYVGWGVVQFRVRDVPQTVAYNGQVFYHTRPIHVPLDGQYDYPHSEIRAFDSANKHVTTPQYRAEADMIWRENLLRGCKPVVSPN